MNKLLLAAFVCFSIFLSSCGEDLTQLEKDIIEIDKYLAANNINAEKHRSGLRYQIIASGTGQSPTRYDDVEVRYEGKLMSNGTVFDATTGSNTVTFPLGNLIEGWQIGLGLIGEGGEIILYIPSTLGYGERGSPGNIPPNANLIFTIELVGVQ